ARNATPPDEAGAKTLESVTAAVAGMANGAAELDQYVDAALASVRTRVNDCETWFDTVMQSFDERYTRSMKTWALFISFVVVVCLNASAFDLYKNVSTNTVLRDTLVQNGQTIVAEAAKTEAAKSPKSSNNAGPASSPEPASSALPA